MEVHELEGGSIKSPAYCNHKRGRNWAAVITGKNAANAHREFLRMSGKIVDLSTAQKGDVVEFGGDYISSGGRRQPDRRWWLVHEICDESITIEIQGTLASAMKAARMLRDKGERNDG